MIKDFCELSDNEKYGNVHRAIIHVCPQTRPSNYTHFVGRATGVICNIESRKTDVF